MMLNRTADVAIIAEIPTTARNVWTISPAVVPAPVAMPTRVPDVMARATVNSVAGPGMKTKPNTIATYVISVA
jgi:hypothetical protein